MIDTAPTETDTVECPRSWRSMHSPIACVLCRGKRDPGQVPSEIAALWRVGGMEAVGVWLEQHEAEHPDLAMRVRIYLKYTPSASVDAHREYG